MAGEVAHRRGGRSGKEDFETCYERQIAEDFAALVELSGENRPHGYPKGCHGIRDPHFDGILDTDMPTFEQYARHNYVTRLGAAPTQRLDYLAEAERHVFPFFGHLPLDRVTRRVLREWVEWMLTKPSARNEHQPSRPLSDEQAARRWAQGRDITVKKTGRVPPGVLRQWREAGSPTPAPPSPRTLSPATVERIYRGAIKPVFRAATQQGEDGEPPLLASSPCEGLRLPPGSVTARPILYGPELGVYLRAVHDLDPETALFVLTETVTGLRWGRDRRTSCLRPGSGRRPDPCDPDLRLPAERDDRPQAMAAQALSERQEAARGAHLPPTGHASGTPRGR
ncbi:hypothetical protein GCM10020001_038830 [Nonomuraea salmonea]